MAANVFEIDEVFALLPGAFKVQQDASVRKGIGVELQPGAVPARALIVRLVGINRIAGIEAVRQGNSLPAGFVTGPAAAPYLPEAAEASAIVLPPRQHTLRSAAANCI